MKISFRDDYQALYHRTAKKIRPVCTEEDHGTDCDCCGFNADVEVSGETVVLWSADGKKDWSMD